MATLTTPRLAIPYPDGTERVTDGDNAMGAIATAVDGFGLPRAMATGSLSPSMAASGGISVGVTFPPGRFSAAPIVQATVAAGSNNYFASVYNPTTTGFTLYVSHRDNTSTATVIPTGWTAILY